MAKPTHRIYQIEDRPNNAKKFWREVGVAWENSDGSLNMQFSVTPHFDKHTIQTRRIEDKPESAED